jgi:hypothetical protein
LSPFKIVHVWGIIRRMLVALKIAMLKKGVRQTRMAVELGSDPARLSRIVNQVGALTVQERRAMADYVGENEADLFPEKVTAAK